MVFSFYNRKIEGFVLNNNTKEKNFLRVFHFFFCKHLSCYLLTKTTVLVTTLRYFEAFTDKGSYHYSSDSKI